MVANCNICPRGCKVDRNHDKGFCNETKKIRIAKIIEHFSWEEPCLADECGTLAIFFSGCNLRCDYCQNFEISRGGIGKEYSVDEFIKFVEEKQLSHSSIDLITPTHFSDELLIAFEKIDKKVPVIWNTNGYETVENIEKVSKFVDVFLTDLKYADDSLGLKYSKTSNYFSKAFPAIKKMCELKTDIEIEKSINTECDDCETKFLIQGVIIRHLVLPNHVQNSFKVLDVIKEHFAERKISLMSQFTPNGHSSLDRKISCLEYKAVVAHLKKLGLTNGYVQEFESADSQFVPNFV